MKNSTKDALQALVAALIFGEDAGIAAQEDTKTLYAGAGCTVHMAPEARKLLAEAYQIAGKVRPEERGGYSDYYLDSVVADHLWDTRREA